MFTFRKPSTAAIRRFLVEQARHDVTYENPGVTAQSAPAGYRLDHTRLLLGQGERAFVAATRALQRWDQLDLGWLEAGPPDTPLVPGAVVVVLVRVLGLWSLNSCRIVHVVDESVRGASGTIDRFGFAYGTLPGHAARGEERFLVEWHRDDGSVWYDILAYSRPRHLLMWLGYPLARSLQKRFGHDSGAAMQAAVRETLTHLS